MLSRRLLLSSRGVVSQSRSLLLNNQNIINSNNTHRLLYPVLQTRQLSTFKNFFEGLKKTVSSDKEAKEQLEKLQKDAEKIQNSESLQKLKQAFEKVKVDTEKVVNTEKIKEGSEGFTKKVNEAFQSVSESDFAKKTKEELEKMAKEGAKFSENFSETGKKFGKTVDDATQKTPYFKTISETLKGATEELSQSSASNTVLYGGYRDSHARKKERERRAKLHEHEQKKKEEAAPTEANPEAGSGIVLHKDSAWKKSWENFRENNPMMQRLADLKRTYEESDNIVVHYLHRIQDSVVSIFSENEHAQVLKEIKMLDPTFNIDEFTQELHDYSIPEVLEAFLHGNKTILKQWCSEATYSMLCAQIDEKLQLGPHFDVKILDLRDVTLYEARMIDERPVLVFTFNSQQITLVRDKQGKVVHGKEDEIENVYYAIAIFKEPEIDPITGGWRVGDFRSIGATKIW